MTTRFAWKDPGGLGLLLAGVFAARPRAGEDDKRAVFTAASHAQKAGDYPWRLAEAAGRGRSGGLSPAAGTTAIGNGSMLRAFLIASRHYDCQLPHLGAEFFASRRNPRGEEHL